MHGRWSFIISYTFYIYVLRILYIHITCNNITTLSQLAHSCMSLKYYIYIAPLRCLKSTSSRRFHNRPTFTQVYTSKRSYRRVSISIHIYVHMYNVGIYIYNATSQKPLALYSSGILGDADRTITLMNIDERFSSSSRPHLDHTSLLITHVSQHHLIIHHTYVFYIHFKLKLSILYYPLIFLFISLLELLFMFNFIFIYLSSYCRN